MTKFLLPVFAAGAMLAIVPVHAETAGRTVAFESDGVQYQATVIDRADGSRQIVGHNVTSGTDFTLEVAKGRVHGEMDGQPVSYAVPKAGSVKARAIALNTGE